MAENTQFENRQISDSRILDRYNPVSRHLHWFMVLAIVAVYALGLIREDLPRGALRDTLFVLHVSLGIIILALTLVRLFWRGLHPAPAPVPGPPLARKAAKMGHVLLYAAMLGLPLLGLAAAWIRGRGMSFFWLFPIPSPIAANRALAGGAETLHALAAHAMMLLAAGHALIALIHQYVLKDDTLARMLPAGRQR